MAIEPGKRTAKASVRIVEDGGEIRMMFDDQDVGAITFKRESGRSGPQAYEKLSKLLDKGGAEQGA